MAQRKVARYPFSDPPMQAHEEAQQEGARVGLAKIGTAAAQPQSLQMQGPATKVRTKMLLSAR